MSDHIITKEAEILKSIGTSILKKVNRHHEAVTETVYVGEAELEVTLYNNMNYEGRQVDFGIARRVDGNSHHSRHYVEYYREEYSFETQNGDRRSLPKTQEEWKALVQAFSEAQKKALLASVQYKDGLAIVDTMNELSDRLHEYDQDYQLDFDVELDPSQNAHVTYTKSHDNEDSMLSIKINDLTIEVDTESEVALSYTNVPSSRFVDTVIGAVTQQMSHNKKQYIQDIDQLVNARLYESLAEIEDLVSQTFGI